MMSGCGISNRVLLKFSQSSHRSGCADGNSMIGVFLIACFSLSNSSGVGAWSIVIFSGSGCADGKSSINCVGSSPFAQACFTASIAACLLIMSPTFVSGTSDCAGGIVITNVFAVSITSASPCVLHCVYDRLVSIHMTFCLLIKSLKPLLLTHKPCPSRPTHLTAPRQASLSACPLARPPAPCV